MKPNKTENATVVVTTTEGTWVFANVRADLKAEAVYLRKPGSSADVGPVAYDLTIDGLCDSFAHVTWKPENPTDQKEG